MKFFTRIIIGLTILSLVLGQLPFTSSIPKVQAANNSSADQYWEYIDYQIVSDGLNKSLPENEGKKARIIEILIRLGEDGFFDMASKEEKQQYLRDKYKDKDGIEVANAINKAEEANGWKAVIIAQEMFDQSINAKDGMPAGKQLAFILRSQTGRLKEICDQIQVSKVNIRNKQDWYKLKDPKTKKPSSIWGGYALTVFYNDYMPEQFRQYRTTRKDWGYDEASPLGHKLTLTAKERSLIDERYYVESFIQFCDVIRPLDDITLETISWFLPALAHEKLLAMAVGKVATKIGAKVLPHLAPLATRFVESRAGRAVIVFGAKQSDKFNFASIKMRIHSRRLSLRISMSELFGKSLLTRYIQATRVKDMEDILQMLANDSILRKYYTPQLVEDILKRTEIRNFCDTGLGRAGYCHTSGPLNGLIVINDMVAISEKDFEETFIHETMHRVHDDSIYRFDPKLHYDPLIEGSVTFFTVEITKRSPWFTGYALEKKMVEAMILQRTKILMKKYPKLSPSKARERAVLEFRDIIFESKNGNITQRLNGYFGTKTYAQTAECWRLRQSEHLEEVFREFAERRDYKKFVEMLVACYPSS